MSTSGPLSGTCWALQPIPRPTHIPGVTRQTCTGPVGSRGTPCRIKSKCISIGAVPPPLGAASSSSHAQGPWRGGVAVLRSEPAIENCTTTPLTTTSPPPNSRHPPLGPSTSAVAAAAAAHDPRAALQLCTSEGPAASLCPAPHPRPAAVTSLCRPAARPRKPPASLLVSLHVRFEPVPAHLRSRPRGPRSTAVASSAAPSAAVQLPRCCTALRAGSIRQEPEDPRAVCREASLVALGGGLLGGLLGAAGGGAGPDVGPKSLQEENAGGTRDA